MQKVHKSRTANPGIRARLLAALGMGGPAAVAPPAQDARHRRHLTAATRTAQAAMAGLPARRLLTVVEYHLLDRDDIDAGTLADFAERLARHASKKHPETATLNSRRGAGLAPDNGGNMKTADIGTQAAKGVAACNPAETKKTPRSQ